MALRLLGLLLLYALCATAQRAPDFASAVAPILQKRCVGCHGPAVQSSGLRLDRPADALRGGSSGAVIVPANSAASRLMKLVSGQDRLRMPPSGPGLTEAEVATLRAWIDQGAQWPDGVTLSALPSVAPKHWAFSPPRNPTLPTVNQQAWIHNPIDRFILARLESERLAPSPEASRRTLIRRLSLDLTGLPPTPAEVDAFVNDSRPEAYENLVDRLLASEHFGEKWARHWLDLARYADSDGYESDQLRPHAWRWRQWVIDALNRNLPFDQFTVWQIAGDLLPGATLDQKLATGFHRNTLSNREGGADLEEYRVEQVVDRVATTGTVWLGLTAGCARCHDHKYDPLKQKEFYQLYAIFNSADEVNIPAPADGEWGAYLRAWPGYLARRRQLLGTLEADLAPEMAEWERRVLDAAENPGKDHRWDRQYEVLGLIWEGNKGGGQLEGVYILRTPRAQRSEAQQRRLFDYFLRRADVVNPEKFKALHVKEIVKKLDELDKTAPPLTLAPVMFENPLPKPNYIHLRGDFRSRGAAVEPGLPAFLPAHPAKPDRLSFARWLVSRENPLTARVTVNRLWQELFGAGLVLTSEDFGVQGSRPTHPELLDWLALQFIDSGWDLKRTIKLIVTSAAYRQSSEQRPELIDKDPQNRLLARQSRFRLSAELIRDNGLAVSGLLSPKIGGPSVHPPQPESVSKEAFETPWPTSTGADRYRRGLYTWLHRTSPFAQNVTFDAPEPNRACSRRERSNTPLQALTLLNDPLFVEMAQAFAERLFREQPALDTERRIDYAFQLAFGRQAKPAEITRLREYLAAQSAQFEREQGAASNFFSFSFDRTPRQESAAWAALASVILNLDEFITRE